LQARNTGDYRPLTDLAGRSRVESVAWFAALADYISAPIAWPKLDDDQKQTIDFVRVAHEENYSVEMGHQLLRMSIPLELQEIQSVYELSHRKKLSRGGLVPALNELPERCFTTGSGGAVHVRIIGWGQWAMFFQRHFCHAVHQNYYFMKFKWCVPDDAKEYADRCEKEFAGLRLYPFVQKFNCTNAGPYRKSVDDCFKVIVATPQLVPAGCWNWLNMRVSYAPMYLPQPGPLDIEWFNYNPPPGTVYDLGARLYQQSLLNHADPIGHYLKLHQMAPYDYRIANLLVAKRFNNHPTYDQAMALYDAVLPYSVTALQTVANTCYSNQPDQYEKWTLQAAELNPAGYYNLADFAWHHTNDDLAAIYDDKACAANPDSVSVANHAEWRVRYYLKKGQTDKAREIADFAGEVYSAGGLAAKAVFMETTSNYDGAFEWFAKIEERYDNPNRLIDFCQRYKKLTGDTRFDAELQKRIPKLFPKGMEKVALGDFHEEPADGVLIQGQNDLLRSAGLKQGNVIVALNGIRVRNFEQYCYVRESLGTPELVLIVWQGHIYHEIKSSPPNHRFGVDFGDYQPDWVVGGHR
jgi:hypothetical protein